MDSCPLRGSSGRLQPLYQQSGVLMGEVSYAQTPWQSWQHRPFSVSSVALEKSSSSPLRSCEVQGIQVEKDLFFPFSYPLYNHCASFVYHSSAEGVDTRDVKKKRM